MKNEMMNDLPEQPLYCPHLILSGCYLFPYVKDAVKFVLITHVGGPAGGTNTSSARIPSSKQCISKTNPEKLALAQEN